MHRRLRRWLADLWKNGIATKFFTLIGVIAAATSPIQFAPANMRIPANWFPPVVVATGVCTLIVAIVWAHPCASMRWAHHHNGTWTIRISRQDLFARDIPIVVTVDRQATTSPEDAGPHSLVAMLVERWFDGDHLALRRSLAEPDAPDSPFPVGHTIPFRTQTRSGLLYCLAEPTSTTHTSWLDLATGYAALWSALRRHNISEIAVPVLGSGFSRGLLSFDGLVSMLIHSFHSASSQGTVARTLHICIHDTDYNPGTMTAAARQLELLGYQRL